MVQIFFTENARINTTVKQEKEWGKNWTKIEKNRKKYK
jgi:hypothetical protein